MSLHLRLAPLSFPGPEGRRIARTSILVAAILRFGEQSLAVRIRNMSVSGALIEGAVLPSPNIAVELVRGDLYATGRVAWVDGGRCGIALDGQVAVDCWISGKATAHQARVDALLDTARQSIGHERRSQAPDVAAPDAEPRSGIGRADVAAGDELDAIIASLALLGDRLTDDPMVVANHLVSLQSIDEAQQRLAALRRRLA